MPDLPRLAEGDLEILRLLSQGWPTERVGTTTGLSDRTVRRRVRALCDRLDVSTPAEAIVWAIRQGLL